VITGEVLAPFDILNAHLRILSGLEIGEPHWHAEAAAKVLG
jgi:hypothetical protein